MSSFHRWTVAACAVASLAAPAAAVPAPPFGVLLREAQIRAPRLAQSQAEIDRAVGLARQGAARPNPVAEVVVENFAGSQPYGRFGRAETTASIGLPLELGGKRPARIAAGQAGVEAARARVAVAGVDFGFALADAYARAEAAAARLSVAEEVVKLAQDDLRVASILVRNGKEADLRAVQARSGAEAARAGRDAARAEQATALAQLSALAGASEPYTSVPPSLLPHADRAEPLPQPDPLASPAYRAALAERLAASQRVRVERTRRIPDVTASLGVRRLAGEDATALVGSFSVPLPLFDRNRGNIDAASAELGGAEAAVAVARLDAEAGVRSGLARFEAAFSRIRAARDGEASAAEAYRLSRLGYEGGKLPLLEVSIARRALADARAASIDARLERLSAEAEVARLAGTTPFGDVP